ncbi:MAG: hypothetical protein JWQ88_847, partial [Rhodoferax sp.]|nr:hypothetical protein [Rhodoferax sp.]
MSKPISVNYAAGKFRIVSAPSSGVRFDPPSSFAAGTASGRRALLVCLLPAMLTACSALGGGGGGGGDAPAQKEPAKL